MIDIMNIYATNHSYSHHLVSITKRTSKVIGFGLLDVSDHIHANFSNPFMSCTMWHDLVKLFPCLKFMLMNTFITKTTKSA